MKTFIQLLIRGYQFFISPMLGSNCRFHPSCSQYSHECFERFSLIRALWYTLTRLSHCHPWHPGGFDPVPDR